MPLISSCVARAKVLKKSGEPLSLLLAETNCKDNTTHFQNMWGAYGAAATIRNRDHGIVTNQALLSLTEEPLRAAETLVYLYHSLTQR